MVVWGGESDTLRLLFLDSKLKVSCPYRLPFGLWSQASLQRAFVWRKSLRDRRIERYLKVFKL